MGKWYSRKPVAEDDGTVLLPIPTKEKESEAKRDKVDEISSLWCYCNQPSYGNMIICDNNTCIIQWFHFDCEEQQK